ncbi:MAG: DUF5103 domain-containing protein [Bacteroidales bacterium]|nr:DUF5103 domain-containing protein [Bacteroidales bacterium]
MKQVYIFLFVSMFSLYAWSVNLPNPVVDAIYSDQFKTVQFHPVGKSLEPPVVFFNNMQQLCLSFDDLSNEVQNLYYTVFHCDRNWKISAIPQEEYLLNFTDFVLDDYAFSKNTLVKYVNYQLLLPNDDVDIKYSGNWAVVVFNKDHPDEPLIVKRFFVVEPVVGLDARIRDNRFDVSGGAKQEIDFVLSKNGFQVRNPRTDLKVVVSQNFRFDNAVSNLNPLFDDEKKLEYGLNSEINFTGDNEYRSFEFREIEFPGRGVESIKLHRPLYHITLKPDKIRRGERYSSDREINGLYRVEMYRSDYPEVEADYMMVHFTLKMEQVLAGGGVYVFGALTNRECSKQNEMKWNPEENQYELSLLLKQGYYNYCYAWKDQLSNKIQIGALEGSHTETENEYRVYVYYGRNTDRYDRLIGYGVFNSLTNRSYQNR